MINKRKTFRKNGLKRFRNQGCTMRTTCVLQKKNTRQKKAESDGIIGPDEQKEVKDRRAREGMLISLIDFRFSPRA